jgi:hypothetical protein
MSKRLFGGSDDAPEIPLNRSSSLGRTSRKDRRPSTAKTMQEIEREPLPSVDLQREKERAFQRRASTKRKAVPESSVFTTTPPQNITQPPSARTQSQLPSFTFSTKALERSHGAGTEVLPPAPWVKDSSVSMGGHSRMASEMSVPMILDFDLAKHQDSAQFSNAGGLDFGFRAEIVEKELTDEEKADIISNISPMHVVNITPKKEPKCRNSTLKRLFSRRKSEKLATPPKQDTAYLLSSSKSSIDSKRSYDAIPNFEANGSRTIYARPPIPIVNTSLRKDGPPRLSIQIPDSTMDRASKIFQSIYMAHAQAQESLTQHPTWPYPTPDTTPLSTTIIQGKQGTPVAGDITSKWGFDHRPAPKPIMTSAPSPTSSPLTEMIKSLKQSGEYSAGSSPLRLERQRTAGTGERAALVAANRKSRVTSGRWLSAFPIPPGTKGPSSKIVDLSDVDESDDDSDSDWDDSDEEWDNDTLSSDGGKIFSIKEPAWEMLSPPSKVVVT